MLKETDNQEKLVWYASYGSNMMYARFLCYIQGGTFYANKKPYNGCKKDQTPPVSSKAIIIPYEMYFGNKSSSWINKNGEKAGVAFLDTSKRAITLGRMYLIKESQFLEIWEQESNSPEWYHDVISLGEYEGYPVKTFTNLKRRVENSPTEEYLDVMKKGIEEMIGDVVVLRNVD